MTASVLAAFIGTCILLAVTPGPNMALIIANTLGGGLRAGLVTLAGTLTGLTALVIVATVGMASIMVLMSEWFDVIRWIGAVYLFGLGVLQLRSYLRGDGRDPARKPPSAGSRYAQGVLVALSNPKVLLFLGALLPQFVVEGTLPIEKQLIVLAAIFVATLAAVDLAYTIAIARARSRFDMARLRVLDGIAGCLLVAGGLVLAVSRRS